MSLLTRLNNYVSIKKLLIKFFNLRFVTIPRLGYIVFVIIRVYGEGLYPQNYLMLPRI